MRKEFAFAGANSFLEKLIPFGKALLCRKANIKGHTLSDVNGEILVKVIVLQVMCKCKVTNK